jgi:hypothetical protein
MLQNPDESPTGSAALTTLPAWRTVFGAILWIIAVDGGLLAIVMWLAGLRWLYMELSNSWPLSLSLALIGGSMTAWIVSLGLAWLAYRIMSRRPATQA